MADGDQAAGEAFEPFVAFAPSGRRGFVATGTSALEAARRLGADLDSVCGGRGICGRCQVEVSTGAHAKLGITVDESCVSAFNEVEQRYADKRGLKPGRRLGCQTRILGHVVLDVPEESQLHRQVVRKDADARPVAVDPVVRLAYVHVAEPDMHDPSGDARRLREALAAQWNLPDLVLPLPVLARLQKTLRAGHFRVTAAIHRERTVVALYPGLAEHAYGVAVDIGSTTIAAHLVDLATGAVVAAAGVMNPQIRFGEDLMSRVSYVMMNPGGEREMTEAVREAVDRLIGAVAAEAGIERDAIVDATVVGNPVMHHLFLGLDPTELGGAPFALATDAAAEWPAVDLGLTLAPGAFVYVLPCIAGHVGADTAGVVLAEAPHQAEGPVLLVDVGTNAEIVLGDRHRLLACSSPTGPAFEGAQISSGQRAAPGAIERFRIDRETLEPRYKVIGCDLWSDEPGFAEATAATGVTGLCGSGIIEAVAELFLAGILAKDGRIDGAAAARTPRVVADGRTFSYLIREEGPRLAVTQGDVRAIQLAKAALAAGTRLLMDRLGIDRVAKVRLAGAFGSHIDVRYAMALGLVPDCPVEAVASAGNAAGTGARIALVNRAARTEIEDVVRGIEKVETAIEPGFQAAFVAAMGFPHDSEPYDGLWTVFDRPPETSTSTARPERSRRRGRGEG
jgi:uncharacterized 2Fe-2S/4Fe-4S cluster protein (DUF4445 family)